MFGIRRRRTKVIEKTQLDEDIELAKDALAEVCVKTNSLTSIAQNLLEAQSTRTRNKINYTLFILFGITGCYLSYKYIPIYLVSLKYFKICYFINLFKTNYNLNKYL